MIMRLFSFLTFWGLPLLILISISISSAAVLTIPSGVNVVTDNESITAEKVKPSECDGITLDNNIITGSGAFTDTAGNSSLLIGNENANTIDGSDGDDCIVGSNGNDTIDGGSGSDVCLGGNGDDGFKDCETCYGDSGSDTDITVSCTISNSIESP
jgi:Ca2+-binding RTX toxin-like protein